MRTSHPPILRDFGKECNTGETRSGKGNETSFIYL